MNKCDELEVFTDKSSIDKIFENLRSFGWKKEEGNTYSSWFHFLKTEYFSGNGSYKIFIYAIDMWGNYYSSKFTILGLGLINKGVKMLRERIINIIKQNDRNAIIKVSVH